MKYPWLDAYCQAKNGCEKDFKEEWGATRYQIGGKMFAMQGTDNTGKAIITLKLEPSFGDLLRQEHKDIIPGYYMNKVHWNSVFLDGDVPDALLEQMVDESYRLVFGSLPKKTQKELLGRI